MATLWRYSLAFALVLWRLYTSFSHAGNAISMRYTNVRANVNDIVSSELENILSSEPPTLEDASLLRYTASGMSTWRRITTCQMRTHFLTVEFEVGHTKELRYSNLLLLFAGFSTLFAFSLCLVLFLQKYLSGQLLCCLINRFSTAACIPRPIIADTFWFCAQGAVLLNIAVCLFTVEKTLCFILKRAELMFGRMGPLPSIEFRTKKLHCAFPIILLAVRVVEGGGSERRQDIINGAVNCIQHDGNNGIFSLSCSEFNLTDSSNFTMNDYITLEKNEVFEGNDNHVVLYGRYNGLFRINTTSEANGPSSLEDAPVIRNLHIIGGETHIGGGFIIQRGQKHFIVEACSSSGKIQGRDSGGICGEKCSGDILITACWSSGSVTGNFAGGISGNSIGDNGNGDNTKVKITQCYSTGDITSSFAGGICGARTGHKGGYVVITHSYSTGKIDGMDSGGICGFGTGDENGVVIIEQCYSEGSISGGRSGGITGRLTGNGNGIVHITNSYSHGRITGCCKAGGICGQQAEGTVIITNVYASGDIANDDASGIIGSIDQNAKEINVTLSVYNDGPIVRANDKPENFRNEKNSGNLSNIIGQVYCYNADLEECWNSESIWRPIADDFPVLRPPPTPSPSPTPSVTPSATPTGSVTRTATITPTPSRHPRKPTPRIIPVQYPRRSVIHGKNKRCKTKISA